MHLLFHEAATVRSGKARATIGKYGYYVYGNHAVDNGRSKLERISGATSARLDSFVTTAPVPQKFPKLKIIFCLSRRFKI